MIRTLLRPAPVPDHLLRGDAPAFDGLLTAGTWALVGARVLAAPAVLVAGGPWMALPLAALVAGVWASTHRRPRAVIAPVGEEAVFLGGCALLAAWALVRSAPPWQVGLALLAGLGGALGIVALIAAWVWHAWGRRPALVRLWRPWFRVLGDNPATITLVGRVRLVDGPLVLDLPRCADGPVSAALYTPGLKWVAAAPWESLRDDLERGGARAVLPAAPGRYVVSVRYYRPWPSWRAPRVVS